MTKIKLGPEAMLLPMPAVLVGGKGEKGISFATIAWAGVVNSTPPMIQVSIRKSRFTHELITASGQFSVNIPSADQAQETDYCGMVSGRDVDKAAACGFTVFYGTLENAPLIEQCPMNIECRVAETVILPSHDVFIGEVKEVHLDESLKIDRSKETVKIDPLVFMGTHYTKISGEILGRAFSVGKTLAK